MRVGHNPARFVENVDQPAKITVCVVNCIPFLSGYYEQSLDVLKVVVESLHATRVPEHPYDVMMFDNHSCKEVRDYLKQVADEGKIQYLVLSDVNIGKIGAWNFMFGAAQGETIVFSDGDIEFRPGWLPASLELFEAFPNVGMVTARPLRTPMEYSTATLEWARQAGNITEGCILPWETVWEHVKSLAVSEETALAEYPNGVDYQVNSGGRTAFIGAAHFQFTARRELLHKLIPLPSEQPMRGERRLDIAVNEMGFLRLTTEQALVCHLGNRLLTSSGKAKTPTKKGLLRTLLWLPGIRHVLLWMHNQIFRLYFINK